MGVRARKLCNVEYGRGINGQGVGSRRTGGGVMSGVVGQS